MKAGRLGLEYAPVGILLADKKPADAVSFKKAGNGCIAPVIFSAAKGRTVAFNRDPTGYPCRIFPGIERVR